MRCNEIPARTINSYLLRVRPLALAAGFLLLSSACSKSETPTGPVDNTHVEPLVAVPLAVVGHGDVPERFSAELWVQGTTAYTTTWGTRGTKSGNAVKIWDVSGSQPALVDSLIVASAGTLGDVQVSDDGTLLVVAIEPRPSGGIAIYSLANPRQPQLITRYTSPRLENGVHTAEVARVNGKLYAFCAIDPSNLVPAKLVIVDLSVPSTPVETTVLTIGTPFIHDVFVRNGMLFAAEWNDGLAIYDIGAGGGSITAPAFQGRVLTVGGQVHNVWWYNDPSSGSRRYAFVGEEGPGSIGSSSVGDIHVVDVSNFARPVEVAVFAVIGAGVHNFSMDETRGLLYAAYYNGGVRVLDVRGDLSTCTAAQKTADNRCDLAKMGRLKAFANTSPNGLAYVWGVHFASGALYASDMLTGLWKFAPP